MIYIAEGGLDCMLLIRFRGTMVGNHRTRIRTMVGNHGRQPSELVYEPWLATMVATHGSYTRGLSGESFKFAFLTESRLHNR